MTTLPATEPALQRAEARRTADRRTADLTAYDLYLRALAIYFPITKQRVLEALGHLEQAIAIDRQFGPALAWAAICSLRLVNDGWVAEHEKVRCRAIGRAHYSDVTEFLPEFREMAASRRCGLG
jgi:hypothetical protein